jgi:glycosyltransferase involved in cell wall biosynthesis
MAKISNPTISVVIPTYNRAQIIGRTIQSVLNQTYPDFEVIIVDDGSTDNTEEVVKGFGDDRLRYIRMKENSGTAGVPRNKGIEAARGEYIALLDSDDEWLPEKLEKQVSKFKSLSPDVGVVYCGYACVNGKTGETLIEYLPNARGDVFRSAVEGRLRLAGHTPLIRKECFEKAGVFDVELLGSEDWDMWIRLAQHCYFDFVPEILARYYVYGAQKSANLERQIQGYERITRKYQNHLSKRLLSKRLQHIGTLCCYQGDFKKARRYFGEAIRANPLDTYAYIRFILCQLAPKLYQARLKRLYAQAASRQGGVISW